MNRYIAYRAVWVHNPQLRSGRSHKRLLNAAGATRTPDPQVRYLSWIRRSIDPARFWSGTCPKEGLRGKGSHLDGRHVLRPDQSSWSNLSRRHSARGQSQRSHQVDRRKVVGRWSLSSECERSRTFRGRCQSGDVSGRRTRPRAFVAHAPKKKGGEALRSSKFQLDFPFCITKSPSPAGEAVVSVDTDCRPKGVVV